MSQHAFLIAMMVLFGGLLLFQPVSLWLKLRSYADAANKQRRANDATIAMQREEYDRSVPPLASGADCD